MNRKKLSFFGPCVISILLLNWFVSGGPGNNCGSKEKMGYGVLVAAALLQIHGTFLDDFSFACVAGP